MIKVLGIETTIDSCVYAGRGARGVLSVWGLPTRLPGPQHSSTHILHAFNLHPHSVFKVLGIETTIDSCVYAGRGARGVLSVWGLPTRFPGPRHSSTHFLHRSHA